MGPAVRARAVGRTERAGALGRAVGSGTIREPSAFNIGLTAVDTEAAGEVPILDGDSFVGARRIDLIKIDVEGAEVDVLEGLMSVLRRDRPAVYIEVSATTHNQVMNLFVNLDYRLQRATAVYDKQFNLTILPN